ncbi:MAG: helix-turn-helix transcriptional regulator [Gemmatimonadetes bacterium]|nr:helix-turn-helix transcriptional regulator [Gemmatimonadota bacterium]MYF17239.1 helix-turn-helix transcriptional regulator [Gemmatimonadota bacterium]
MSGHHSFEKLRARMTPERRAYNAAKTKELLAEISLRELRQARAQSQADLAKRLQVERQAIAEMERRADMYVGNLRRCIEGMGGRLEVVAHFPKGSVTITNFSEVDAKTDE